MADEVENIGVIETEMLQVLEQLLADDVAITARAVARLHPSLKAASSITRNSTRRAILMQFQARQAEFRRWRSRTSKQSAIKSATALATQSGQISDLKSSVQMLTASHVAMLRAVGELGGFCKWAQFYESYAASRKKLEDLE